LKMSLIAIALGLLAGLVGVGCDNRVQDARLEMRPSQLKVTQIADVRDPPLYVDIYAFKQNEQIICYVSKYNGTASISCVR
jgi:hypothetical protein